MAIYKDAIGRMIKLLVIAPYSYLPWFSGGQKLIAQFLEYLGKETDLTVVTVKENDFSLAYNYYKYIPLLKKESFDRYSDFSLVSKITKLVKKEKFDAVIWEHPYLAWLAYRVKKKTGVKTIIHSHNIEHQRFRSTGKWWWRILRMYERWAFKKADHIFFITPEDEAFAIGNWKIDRSKCIEVPFGIENRQHPLDKPQHKQMIKTKYALYGDEHLFLFNGLLDYKPNLDALMVILDQVNPMLLQSGLSYRIIICGKRLPAHLNELKSYADKNIIYAGFVGDIDEYFKAADLFLNPVQSGGGIKTKMVEAIGFGTTVIATETGAIGIDRSICGKKLIVVPDDNWQAFADAIIKNADRDEKTPAAYYDKYYWGNIIRNKIIQKIW